MKKVMPFVSYLKEQMVKSGANAFNTTLDFDEYEIINTNVKYLQNTLQVSFNKKKQIHSLLE
jgi:hypothetical protein